MNLPTHCPQCGEPTTLVTVKSAASVTQTYDNTADDWHATEDTDIGDELSATCQLCNALIWVNSDLLQRAVDAISTDWFLTTRDAGVSKEEWDSSRREAMYTALMSIVG